MTDFILISSTDPQFVFETKILSIQLVVTRKTDDNYRVAVKLDGVRVGFYGNAKPTELHNTMRSLYAAATRLMA